MRVLALDISSKAGWALLEGEKVNGELPRIVDKGLILGKSPSQFGVPYPTSYLRAANAQALALLSVTNGLKPDVVVIEQLNLGKSRNTQRILDWTHCLYVQWCEQPISYIDSSAWRKTIGLTMSKDDKKDNSRLSKAKKEAAVTHSRLDKEALGVKGKITKKHLAIRWVNEKYDLKMIMKNNDECDAIGLGVSWFWGAAVSDGT